jgi:hypothetical protein
MVPQLGEEAPFGGTERLARPSFQESHSLSKAATPHLGDRSLRVQSILAQEAGRLDG